MSKKNSVMPVPTGSSVLPKLIGSAIALALLVVVVRHPSDAADLLKGLIGFGATVVDGIASFIRQMGA